MVEEEDIKIINYHYCFFFLLVINILGVLILFTAIIGTISAFYRDQKTIHVIYSVVVLIALAFQIITAICIYQLAANSKPLLSFTWNESLKTYREYAQNKVYNRDNEDNVIQISK